MKKAISLLTAFITAISVGGLFASAADDNSGVSLFEGEKLECAKGQTVTVPIEITANDDFESAQFKLIYAKKFRGKIENSGLTITDISSTRKNMSLSWNDFKDEGYVNILMYCNAKEPVQDGEIADIQISVNTDVDITEYELKLVPVIFATFKDGERKVNESGVVICSEKTLGDSNGDGKVNVRDAARLSVIISKGEELPLWADYNGDGKVNVRDCACIARDCATGVL